MSCGHFQGLLVAPGPSSLLKSKIRADAIPIARMDSSLKVISSPHGSLCSILQACAHTLSEVLTPSGTQIGCEWCWREVATAVGDWRHPPCPAVIALVPGLEMRPQSEASPIVAVGTSHDTESSRVEGIFPGEYGKVEKCASPPPRLGGGMKP